MLKRPSSRRKSKPEGVNLNLVPILDTMVTLIGFLLFTMSFLAIVSIESPFPQASTRELQEKLKEKPLQLTVSLRPNETEIWSPFQRVVAKTIPNQEDGTPNLQGIHAALVEVKQKFPAETKVVFVPYAGATYDTLISVIDTMRMLEPTDPPIFVRNQATGNDEPLKTLFSEVIFGNLLGDS